MIARLVRTAAAALLLLPTVARAEGPASPDAAHKAGPSKAKPPRTARVTKSEVAERGQPRTCTKTPVEVTTGVESATFALAKCDGAATPLAVAELSILARPPSAPRPKWACDARSPRACQQLPVDSPGTKPGADVAPGIRRIDARLVERLEVVVDHFRREGAPAKVLLVSGYRPLSAGSYHQLGRALDFRVDGVTNEALVAFCKTLPDTGCGYYPNSVFVHMDVRNPGTGHISWIDVSGPGERPKYVSQWPLPAGAEPAPSPPPLPGPLAASPDDAIDPPTTRLRGIATHPYVF